MAKKKVTVNIDIDERMAGLMKQSRGAKKSAKGRKRKNASCNHR